MKSALLLCLLAAPALAGKVYQWRDADGRVFYSDQPPPSVQYTERKIRPNTVGQASRASSADQANNETQVVLWVSASCEPACSQALELLDRRGVQYDVRNVDPANEKSMLAFFNVVGTMQARPPVLQLGKEVLKEFNSPLWQAALSKAGYGIKNTPAKK